MGGGMPIGAFICSTALMSKLKNNPKLGHITTFGGHPISCIAALETLNELCETSLVEDVKSKEQLFREVLKHPKIKEIRGIGLMLAIELECAEETIKLVERGMEKGIITFFFLLSIFITFLYCKIAFLKNQRENIGNAKCPLC